MLQSGATLLTYHATSLNCMLLHLLLNYLPRLLLLSSSIHSLFCMITLHTASFSSNCHHGHLLNNHLSTISCCPAPVKSRGHLFGDILDLGIVYSVSVRAYAKRTWALYNYLLNLSPTRIIGPSPQSCLRQCVSQKLPASSSSVPRV